MPSSAEQFDILRVLQRGEIKIEGQFLNSSNYTFLATAEQRSRRLAVVYKPVRGERPLWDFPANSLGRREAAAFRVSEALGWKLVPETVYRRKAPLGAGSIQLFIEHNPEEHFFNLVEEDRQRLRPAAVFDLLVNNADRKGGHILHANDGHLWLIDHGLCFHVEEKLRTILWDFAGEAIPAGLLVDIDRVKRDIDSQGEIFRQLRGLLRLVEIAALEQRCGDILRDGVFPYPPRDRRPYPFPPV